MSLQGDAHEQESNYSIVEQASKLLKTAILENAVITKLLPSRAAEFAHYVKFEGSHKPAMPVNWRFAESVAVLKATEGIMMNALLTQKYGMKPQEVVVNIDHAQLFIASCLLTTIKTSEQRAIKTDGFSTSSVFPSCDIYRNSATAYRCCAAPRCIRLPHDAEVDSDDYDKAQQFYQQKAMKFTAAELDHLSNDILKISGTTVHSVDEYLSSEHGIVNADRQLWNVSELPNASQKPCWWPPSPETSPTRPLAGLKVVDFSRIIAAPTLTRGLAEYGASVMRITSPHLPDMGLLHPDMGWGKWNASLDVRNPNDLENAKQLIREADVVVYGYRPEVMSKYGLGCDDVLELCKSRDRGPIVAQLDCYGWVGPWAHRTGWQQISDACCGVSLAFGQAMHGSDSNEPVTPIFPNSDHCAGLSGQLGVMSALLMRAEKGGSYVVDCSINSYSHWLVQSVGVYPPQVWEELWSLYEKRKLRHYHPMQYLFPLGIRMLRDKARHLFNDDFFEDRDCKAMDCTISCLKPVLRFPSGKVQLRFQVGTRTNGVDNPIWPLDLCIEVVKNLK